MSMANPSVSRKYEQLKTYIKEYIASNNLKPHDRLPARNELVSRLGFSEITIRKGLAELVSEGTIYLQQGKGAFVAEQVKEYHNIAMVVPEFGLIDRWPYVSYLSNIVQSALDEARNHNANVVLYMTRHDHELERFDLLRIPDSKIDAAVIFYEGGSKNIDCLEHLLQRGIPFVVIDRYEPQIDTDYIVTDNYHGAYRAVRLMIEHGYRDIWHFTSEERASSLEDRLRGYKQALDEIDAYDESRVFRVPCDGNGYLNSICENVQKLIQSDAPRIGIFVMNGIELAAIYRYLSEQEIDMSKYAFACFDATPIQQPGDSLFIQVLQPEEMIGRTCIQLVVEKLKGFSHTKHLILRPEVHVTNPAGEQANLPRLKQQMVPLNYSERARK